MKKYILSALIIAGAGFGLLSCNNGDYDANPNTNNNGVYNPLKGVDVSLLTTGSWKMSSAIWVSQSNDTLDIFGDMDECEKDNIFTFSQPDTLITDEGASICFSGDPQVRKDEIWSMFSNNSKIKISDLTNNWATTEWDIVTLTNSVFVIRHSGVVFNNVSGTTTATYTRP